MVTKATLLDDVSLLVQEGVYADQETLVQDALRALLRGRPELRKRMALALYKQHKASLARASEIAGVDQESFKELLREAGIQYCVEPISEAVIHEVEHFMQLRNKE